MYCRTCHAAVRREQNYCRECGSALENNVYFTDPPNGKDTSGGYTKWIAATVAVVAVISVLCGAFAFFFGDSEEDIAIETVKMVIWEAVYFGVIALFLFGPANKHTANDNTSGVITLVEIMAALPEEAKSRFAFVFFDLEETGLFGSSDFAKKHKIAMLGKLLINFDCVSDGSNILLALKKDAVGFEPLLEKCFASNESFNVDIRSSGVFYPSDQAKFPCGVGVAALKYSKLLKTEYMDRIHTTKDTVFEEKNVEFLKNCVLKLVNELTD